MYKTTVIIPNYNGIAYIEKCLLTVLASETKTDVIVVDNGSADGSKELVKSRFPEVTLVELETNTGFCFAVNTGIEKAKTPYVILLNNDTEVSPDAFKRLEEDLDRDDTLFSVQSKMVSLKDKDKIDGAGDIYCALGWAHALGKGRPSSKYTGLKKVFSACAGAAIYRKEILDKIGYLDNNHFAYLEDVDLGYRARIYGYKNAVDLDSVVFHAGSASSGSRYNEFKIINSAKNSIYLIYKNMPLVQLIINLPLLLLGYFIKFLFFLFKGYAGTYLKGIGEGFKLSFDKNTRKNKVRFAFSRLSRYIYIEIMLLINIVRMFL